MKASDLNKDLGFKAKDLDPKAKAKVSRYQGQIFYRSFYVKWVVALKVK